MNPTDIAGKIIALLAGTITQQSGTAYTLALTDAGTEIEFNASTDVTVTVPTFANVPFPTASTVILRQMGTGEVTIQGDTGVTVVSPNGLSTRAQYSTIGIVVSPSAQDVWVASGDLTP